LACKLEAARASELHEHDRAIIAKQELAASQLARNTEQLALGAERVARALAEGQAQSKGQRITQLEATLTQKKEGLKIIEDAMAGK
jgi:hypothetical protein